MNTKYLLLVLFPIYNSIAQPIERKKQLDTYYSSQNIKSTLSTSEKQHSIKYFLSLDSTPHINEEIILYSVERKKHKIYYTDSLGKIEALIPWGTWECYVKKMGKIKKAQTYILPEKGNFKGMGFITKDYYNWDSVFIYPFKIDYNNVITSESEKFLNDIATYMNRVTTIKIDLLFNSYVLDEKSNLNYSNTNLSRMAEQKAISIKNYLITRGIEENRIKTTGISITDKYKKQDDIKIKIIH